MWFCLLGRFSDIFYLELFPAKHFLGSEPQKWLWINEFNVIKKNDRLITRFSDCKLLVGFFISVV